MPEPMLDNSPTHYHVVGRIVRLSPNSAPVVYTPCTITRTVKRMDFIPITGLCYMGQMSLRKVDWLVGLTLSNEPFKSGCRGQQQGVRDWKHAKDMSTTHCWLDNSGDHVAGNGLQLTASKKIGASVLQPQETELCWQPEWTGKRP